MGKMVSVYHLSSFSSGKNTAPKSCHSSSSSWFHLNALLTHSYMYTDLITALLTAVLFNSYMALVER